MFSRVMRNTPRRMFSTYALNNKNIVRKLPTKDLSLKEHDPELYHYIECEKAR